jgi:predicted lipoprotein with Yx(FWY)xxD motif
MKPNYTLILSYSDGVGLHLSTIDDKGIYYFAMDVPDDPSTIIGEWIYFFKPFTGANLNVPSTLDLHSFSITAGENNANQIIYRGWQLFTYNQDVKLGDATRDALTGDATGYAFTANQTIDTALPQWFLMKPDYNIMIAYKANQGSYLTDGEGRALYINLNDGPESPSIVGNYTQFWPPYNVTPTVAPSFLTLDEFKSFMRSDGLSQVEFLNRPLYYYIGDLRPGDLKGENLLGQWFVLDPYHTPLE